MSKYLEIEMEPTKSGIGGRSSRRLHLDSIILFRHFGIYRLRLIQVVL